MAENILTIIMNVPKAFRNQIMNAAVGGGVVDVMDASRKIWGVTYVANVEVLAFENVFVLSVSVGTTLLINATGIEADVRLNNTTTAI